MCMHMPVAVQAAYLPDPLRRSPRGSPGTPGAQRRIVSAYQQHVSLTAAAPNQTSLTAAARGPEQRTIGRLAALVLDVATQLDPSLDPSTSRKPLPIAVAECTEVLEGCLQAQRDAGGRDESMATSKDELRRLARLLTMVDRADLAIVLRQIRRVLGRFDVAAG